MDSTKGSKKRCILILGGFSPGDRFEFGSVDQQVRNQLPSLNQGSNLLSPVLCGTWTSVTNANHSATEPVNYQQCKSRIKM